MSFTSISTRYPILVLALLLAGCSEGPDKFTLKCVPTVTKSNGWIQGEIRDSQDLTWSVYRPPYSGVEKTSSWEFIVNLDERVLTIVTDEILDRDSYCWKECGRIKTIDLSSPEAVIERQFLGGRIRQLRDVAGFYSETWTLGWRSLFGVVFSASGRFQFEFVGEPSLNDPIQDEKRAVIDFVC